MGRYVGYVGVVGPGAGATSVQIDCAEHVGALLAANGHVVVTGGLDGVMGAASRGAAEAGGTTLGLLPGADRTAGNPWLTVSVPTGLGEMRNALLVRASDVIICVGWSWGTLSEVALAIRTAVPVVVVAGLLVAMDGAAAGVDGSLVAADGWESLLPDGDDGPIPVDSPQEAVAVALELLSGESGTA